MTFKEWLDERQVYSTRLERICEDLEDLDRLEFIHTWLKAAYDTGYNARCNEGLKEENFKMTKENEVFKDYVPDNWVIIKIKGDYPHYRVLGGWSGGYTTGDSWRLNSGITRHEFDGDYWYFYGSSGSCYKCYVDSYGLKMNNAHIWNRLKERYGNKVELLEEQEWNKRDWGWIIK